MTTSTPEKADGLKVLQDAIEKIKITITDLGGVFNIQMPVMFRVCVVAQVFKLGLFSA